MAKLEESTPDSFRRMKEVRGVCPCRRQCEWNCRVGCASTLKCVGVRCLCRCCLSSPPECSEGSRLLLPLVTLLLLLLLLLPLLVVFLLLLLLRLRLVFLPREALVLASCRFAVNDPRPFLSCSM